MPENQRMLLFEYIFLDFQYSIAIPDLDNVEIDTVIFQIV